MDILGSMFGLSFVEVIAIGVILLIVVGPKQLPEVARTIARFMNEFKRTTSEFTDSFYNIRSDITKSVDQAREKLVRDAGLSEIKDNLQSVGNDLNRENPGDERSEGESGSNSGGGSVT